MAEKENEIQNDVLKYLKMRGILAWRNNSNAMRGRKNNFKTGIGDIIGCLPDGTFLSVEIKTMTGVLSPAQKKFIDDVDKLSGCAIVATSIRDVAEQLENWL